MYSLDVNFLTDRNLELKGPAVAATADGPSLQQQLPIYIGAGVMVVLPLLAGLSLLFVGWQKEQAQTNIQTLEAELAKLNAQNKKIQEIQGKTKTIDDDIAGLVGVFNQIKPWSALFQEITNQLPSAVQLESIQQDGGKLTLSGFAGNYAALNDFMLTLQSSQFLQADQTKLMTATAAALPITGEGTTLESGGVEEADTEKGTSTVLIPAGVRYTIQTAITETPDKDLMRVLIRNGAAGLVARFKFLELKGVLDRPSDAPTAPPPILEPTPAEGEAAPQP